MSSQTYAGHASVCAAGLANMAILEREELIGRGAELEDDLLRLEPLEDHALVAEVRGGTGLMVSVAISPPHLAAG